MGTKASARQFLVKADGIEGLWATKTGGNVTSESQKVYDGGKLKPDIITNPPVAEDVTITRPWDIERDPDIATELLQLVGSWETTVSVTPTDADLIPIASPRVYPNAKLIGVSEPEVDAASGDPSVFGLTFAIPDYR
jgi:hypothetical protein